MDKRLYLHLATAGLTTLIIGAIVLFWSYPKLLVYVLLAIVAVLSYGALYLILAARLDPHKRRNADAGDEAGADAADEADAALAEAGTADAPTMAELDGKELATAPAAKKRKKRKAAKKAGPPPDDQVAG